MNTTYSQTNIQTQIKEIQDKFKDFTNKLDSCKDHHNNNDIDIARTLGTLDATILGLSTNISKLHKLDEKINKAIPLLDVVIQEIKTLKEDNEKHKQFRWSMIAIYTTITVVITTVFSVGGMWMAYKNMANKFIAKDSIDVYEYIKLTESKNNSNNLSTNATRLEDAFVDGDIVQVPVIIVSEHFGSKTPLLKP